MISVVIPNFNKEEFVAATLESTVAQSHVSEIVVVDDGSTDNSLRIIEEAMRRDQRIILIKMTENHNASYCRNRGLEQTTGQYVIFLDSDDILQPNCCANRLAAAQRSPDHDMWIFPMLVFRETFEHAVDKWAPQPGNHLRHFLSHRLDWQTMQPLWRRSFLVDIGGFNVDFFRFDDPECHARALLRGARVKCFPSAKPDCFYRAFPSLSREQVTRLSRLTLADAIRFYHDFFPIVPRRLASSVAGTLFAVLRQHAHWWRKGLVSQDRFEEVAASLIATCEFSQQRLIMQGYVRGQLATPFHIPGVNRLTQNLLRL